MSARITPLTIPKWGLEMTEGTLSGWLRRVGERLEAGDPVAEIESEKIVNTLDAPVAGILRRILVEPPATAPVGTLIALIAGEVVPEEELDLFVGTFDAAPGANVSAAQGPARPGIADTPARPDRPGADEAVRIAPPVRRLARRLGVDVERVRGTGVQGRVLLGDVELAAAGARGTTVPAPSPPEPHRSTREAAARPAAGHGNKDGVARPEVPGPTAAASAATRVVPLSAVRRTIARRMQQAAAAVPLFHLTADLPAGALLARRQVLAEAGIRVSINDLVVHRVARAITRYPKINVRLVDDALHEFDDVHLTVAMAVRNALVAPVLANADRLDEAGVATTLRDLRERGERGALTRAELDGGCLTVSNLGMFGIRQFTSLITPPQCAALSIGRIEEHVPGGGKATSPTLAVTLACDHRVLDGADGARFLVELRSAFEAG